MIILSIWKLFLWPAILSTYMALRYYTRWKNHAQVINYECIPRFAIFVFYAVQKHGGEGVGVLRKVLFDSWVVDCCYNKYELLYTV